MSNEIDYIELGLACADVCKALDRGMNGRRVDEFSHPVCEAIEQLTKLVTPEMHILYDSLTALPIAGP